MSSTSPADVETIDAGDTSGASGRARADARPLRRGDAVGRYLVVDRLGAGGMGVVYRAYDPELDRSVAIKLLHDHQGGPNSSGRSRLLREAQALARLSHANVVTVHDVGSHAGQVFVAMELVQGRTLTQWLAAEARGWRDVLDVMIDAGRGLIAAHDAELVHRDFKPDNVMVGDDGRVRVMDFGLARAASTTLRRAAVPMPVDLDDADSWAEDETGPPARSSLDTRLTRDGVFVGTPAYVAPEQLKGAEADPRTDQYSFCVTLFEALYGQRPFAGANLVELGSNISQGTIVATARDVKVPGWVHRIVVRGLSREPGDRFASMQDLLDALGRDPSRRRRRWMLGLSPVVVGAVAVGGVMLHRERLRQGCVDAAQAIREQWSEPTRAQVRDALLASEASYAERTWQGVDARLSEYVDQWSETREQLCVAAELEDQWRADQYTLARECLDERADEMGALVELMTHPDPDTLQHAVSLVAGLSRVEPCRDRARLLWRVALPEAAGDRQAVVDLRRSLGRVSALQGAAKYGEGLAVAREVLAAAERIDYPPLAIEARSWVGSLLAREGNYDDAATTLTEAYFAAQRVSYEELSASLATELVQLYGESMARPDDALGWARHAEVLVARLGAEHSVLEARLLDDLGTVHRARGELDAAIEHHRRALALREELLGADHPQVARDLNNLALAQLQHGERDEAIAGLRRALEVLEGALGPDHPDVAGALANLGGALAMLGQTDEALALNERSLAIRRAALGEDHPRVAEALTNLGWLHAALGNHEQARSYTQQGLERLRRTLGDEHPRTITVMLNLAEIEEQAGDTDAALRSYEQALAIQERTLGPSDPGLVRALQGLGRTRFFRGDPQAAVDPLRRAVAIVEATGSSDDPRLVALRADLAEAEAGETATPPVETARDTDVESN